MKNCIGDLLETIFGMVALVAAIMLYMAIIIAGIAAVIGCGLLITMIGIIASPFILIGWVIKKVMKWKKERR